MAKKVTYRPGKEAFNLDEKKSLNPYGIKEQKPKKGKK